MELLDKTSLPKEVFGQKADGRLVAQAIRVYLANQRQGNQSTLTRAEVERTRKKLYKQKGTGGARHGDRKAPIFVGGGVTFAPKPRDFSLSMPTVMKKKALYGALSAQAARNVVHLVSGLSALTGKTKELASFVSEVGEGTTLIVTADMQRNVYQAGRNLANTTVTPWHQLSVYDVVRAKHILIMEEVFSSKKETKASKEEVEVKETKEVKKVAAKPKVKVATKVKAKAKK